MEEKRRFKAIIAGKEYTIVGHRSAQHLSTVTEIVNLQLEQLGDIAPDLSVADRSILMAVNAISDQLLKEQEIADLEKELKGSTNRKNNLNSNEKTTKRVPFDRE